MNDKILKAINKVLPSKYFEIYSAYDGGNKILFGIKDRRYKNNQDPLDPWYTIDKRTLKVEGFQPPEDFAFFNMSLKHPIDVPQN